MSSQMVRGLLVAGLLVLAVVCQHVPELITEGPAWCGWKALTGWPCPLCGLSRACCALARGELNQAAQLHLLALVVVPLMGGLWLLCLAELVRGAPLKLWSNRLLQGRLLTGLLWTGAGYYLLRLAAHAFWDLPLPE